MESIRKETCRIAKSFGVSINPALPLLDADLTISRSTLEVAERMLCICGVAALSFHKQEEKNIVEWIHRENINSKLTVKEIEFLEGDAKLMHQMQWQIEGLFALAWACSLEESYEPCMELPNDLQSHFPSIKRGDRTEQFKNGIVFRPVAEVLAALDLYYCLHSYARDNLLAGEKSQLPISINSIMERRRAIEWLFNNNDWDEISLDT